MKSFKLHRMLSSLLAAALATSVLFAFPAQADEQPLTENWGTSNWIWDGDELDENGLASEQDVWMNFRRDFTLESVPEMAKLKIAVDVKYWLYVNGEEVVWEGGVKRGPNPEDTYYDTVDIVDYLQPGKNTIAIQVWYWGNTVGHNNPSGSGGLLVSSDLIDSNTNQIIETGDGLWWSMRSPANLKDSHSTSGLLAEYNVLYDGRQEIDWINPDYVPSEVNGWSLAQNIGEDEQDPGYAGDGPWNDLVERPIPQWKDYGRKPLEFTPVDGYSPQIVTTPISDLGITSNTYSIETDLTLSVVNILSFKLANISFLFGATDANHYYKAYIDCINYLDGGDKATLYLSDSQKSIANIDISNILTRENYKDNINIRLDVINEQETNLYLNDVLIYTLTDNLASNQLSFGYAGELSGTGIGAATIKNITIKGIDGSSYANNFETAEDCSIFQGSNFSNGMQTSELTMLGTLSDNGQKYQAQLPYNCQMVPYIILDDGTEAGKTIKMYTDTYDLSDEHIAYITKKGAQEFEGKNWINGDFLYFDVPDGVKVKEVGFRETGYNVPAGENTDFVGYFDSSVNENDPSVAAFTGGHTWTEEEANTDNNFYDELWKKATRSLYVTIRDQYMDCPDRERGQYIGDAINEIEEAFYSLGPEANAISEKAIRNICDWQEVGERNGRTYYFMSNVRPGVLEQEICAQSLGTALAAENYYLFTGDTELVQDTYQPLYNYLTNYDIMEDGEYSGLISVRTPDTTMYNDFMSNWLDWGNNMDTLVETNAWWYISAKSVRALADVEGVPATQEQKDWLDERLASIEQNFEKFWNEDLQAYATEWNETDWYQPSELENGSHVVDDRVNALGVIFGLIPEERYSQMRDVFMGTESTPAYENASIYMEKYVIQALYMMGYDTDAMSRIEKRMMEMVNTSTDSTLWELWDRTSGTKNHGWSGGSMIAMSRYAAGVEPTGAGYSTWHVVPQLGNFEEINTRVPSEIGNIDVTINKTDTTLDMTVVSPGNNAEIWVPVESGQGVVTSSNAQYKGIKQAYQKDYAVYEISEAGSYTFTATETNKDILDSVIAYAENAKASGEYDNAIESVQKSFDTALENAKTVAKNENASQEEIDQAWKTLLNEIHKLGFVAGDKDSLASLIEAAKEIDLNKYVEAGQAEFTTALEAAKGVYNDGDAMQVEINEAAENLLNAMLNLRYKADKSILEDVLAEAGKVDANAYTAESYAALQAAVAEANDVYNNENATQEEVDAAVTKIQVAMNNLIAVEGTPVETPTENNDTAGSQTGQESTTPKANAAKTGDFAPIVGLATITLAGAVLLFIHKKK
ncbi:alpha-L-rhamnosidase C-terminal domain-containing protein [Clostridium facile]|uniref:FIVAR domain-containing protein n=1 Tax=Clostridium facile TaxID=2763035 RepID=A0ABR7IPL7_9CLOT|nr:alpha-L-rhamnosidase C-terminal domain-containing protein [Clostridium facile]MBC5787061.1 FIVAR domain-containing protein [Clostridium facile]